jgi:murein L,D-transpeptidase YcbB/YkuD
MRSPVFLLLILATTLSQHIFAEQPCPAPAPPQDPVSQRASEYLRALHLPATTDAETASRASVLLAFYRPCDFALAWTSNGQATTAAQVVIDDLRNSDSKGLRPQDYGSPGWAARASALAIQDDASPVELARFDLDLTVAVMRYLLDLSAGRVNPRVLKAHFDTHRNVGSMARFIWLEIVPDRDIHNAIQRLEPPADGYKRVESAFRQYLELERTTHDVVLPPFRRKISPGDAYDALPLLVARLKQLDDMPADAPLAQNPTVYEGDVVDAVKRFQIRHGLTPDGILDVQTYKQLAVPIQQRALQLSLTLERWRWVQHTLEEAPVVINIPEYRLSAYDEYRKVMLSMRVIVGSAGSAGHWRTPILQGNLTTVIFRPYWNVPTSIARKEIIPKIARNPNYLAKNDFEIVNAREEVVHGVSSANLIGGLRRGALRIRQVPGEHNALGLIKFIFPNPYDVYMHGTPLTSLFQRNERDLSHGCIRVEDPVALAVWALRSQQGWTRNQVEESMAGDSNIHVPLSIPIPVLIVYGTAIVEENGEVHFFPDIYGYDAELARALDHVSALRATADREPW